MIVLKKTPVALIFRFILAPDYLFQLRVVIEHCLEFIEREGVELFDTDNGHIFLGIFEPPVNEVVVYFAGAGNQSFYLFRCCRAVADDVLEISHREFGKC